MSTKENLCSICGKPVMEGSHFCPYCGAKTNQLTGEDETSIEQAQEGSIFSGFRTRMRAVGDKAQKYTNKSNIMGLSEKTTKIVTEARDKMAGNISPEMASEVVGNLVGVMLKVARDLVHNVSDEDIKAIDLEAEISFVAFSLGISIDLEQLKQNMAEA